jgi:deoxyribodipyrimidine photo-lyase
MVDYRRTRKLNAYPDRRGRVIYWMMREQRVSNNWALLFAAQKAGELDLPLEVVFTLAPSFPGATLRHYDFMFRGLQEVETVLHSYNIPFTILTGEPGRIMAAYAAENAAGILVTDFSPVKIMRTWKNSVLKTLDLSFYEVDAHNIVPCWLASEKQEYMARTIRPKLHALLESFLVPFPRAALLRQKPSLHDRAIEWQLLINRVKADPLVKPLLWIHPGEAAAEEQLRKFISTGLSRYLHQRNDPNSNAVSGLSPYLHFGHISAQHVALRVTQSDASEENRTAFLEELIVRRELSENFCFYNNDYDSPNGLPDWAKRTLRQHGDDPRPFRYSAEEFETACTHDPLWNAAQRRLLEYGTMHGYMRMYWAKKILEWSGSPAEAFDIALYLNDRYALDGRDPNGYTGIAWSIGGMHDRPWFDRPIYGTIRYMNAQGCARKFDVDKYIHTSPQAEKTELPFT